MNKPNRQEIEEMLKSYRAEQQQIEAFKHGVISKLLLFLMFAALAVMLLSSCSPQKRINRILRKHPELLVKDTLHIRDTIMVNGSSTDTVFQTTITKDTVVLKENNLTIKYYNDGKTTYLKGQCDTVRVPYEKLVPVDRVKNVTEYKEHWWVTPLVTGFIILLLFTIGRLLINLFPLRNL
jgi:hypothetical protein